MLAAAVVGVLMGGPVTIAAPAFDVYVVAIGSSRYAEPGGAGVHGLPRIYGANKSARAVAIRMLAGGAKRAILLTAPDGVLVSAGDVNHAIDSIETQIRSDGPRNALLLFYFAGHGISEGVGWSHFAVPGTFTFRGPLPTQGIEAIAAATMPTADVAARLDKIGIRYVALIDTCYEGKPADFASPVLTGPAIASLQSISGVLRFMNEFHQANPILFSTRPGTIVGTVADPVDDGPDPVAPLARRAMIALDAAARRGGPVTLRAFVDQMTAADLDKLTTPAVTNATPVPDWLDALASFPATPGVLEEAVGTATEGAACCTAAPLEVPPVNSVQGAVEFAKAPGEFVSGGTGLAYRGPIAVMQDSAGAITLSFGKDGDEWELAFAAPKGERLKKGRYRNATRFGFPEAGKPSLAVTSAGHACNEVKGDFSVEEVDYAAGGDRIATFSAAFEQFCDDVPVPLKGTLEMSGR